MDSKRIDLKKSFVQVYDFGEIKLHAYQTNDVMADECFILENDSEVLLLEFPSFYEDMEEFKNYILGLNKKVIAKVFSNHPSGGNEFKDVKSYASRGTIKSMQEGEIFHIVEGFKTAFNGSFASEFHEITDILEESKVKIGGFDLEITYHDEDVEIVFPQINSVYTHMLGHECHSILPSKEAIDGFIHQLEGYLEKGYELILTSHHTPENLEDVKTKIDYLKNVKQIANESNTKEEFIKNVKEKYSDYKCENYLEMTANSLFA